MNFIQHAAVILSLYIESLDIFDARDILVCLMYPAYMVIEGLNAYLTRKSCTGQAQCEVSAYAPSCRRCVATCWQRADTAVTKLQISPLILNGFKNGFHQWIEHIFLVVVEHEKIFFRKKFFWMHFTAL